MRKKTAVTAWHKESVQCHVQGKRTRALRRASAMTARLVAVIDAKAHDGRSIRAAFKAERLRQRNIATS